MPVTLLIRIILGIRQDAVFGSHIHKAIGIPCAVLHEKKVIFREERTTVVKDMPVLRRILPFGSRIEGQQVCLVAHQLSHLINDVGRPFGYEGNRQIPVLVLGRKRDITAADKECRGFGEQPITVMPVPNAVSVEVKGNRLHHIRKGVHRPRAGTHLIVGRNHTV